MPRIKGKKEKKYISEQNKDVFSKNKAENFKNKSFEAYGLKLPPIISIEPTNLPEVEANELRMDNLFHLADDSYALVDYESTYADKSKLKYLSYIVRTSKRQLSRRMKEPTLRMLVLYTADVARGDTNPDMNIGCMQFHVEEAFLSELDSEGIEEKLRCKIQNGIPLSENDQMSFMILPLTWKGTEAKRECIRRCFELIKMIEDVELQIFLLSNILVFTDKVISKEDSNMMKEWMQMTKVERLFYEEKVQAVKDAKKAAKKEAKKETREEIAKSMLEDGVSIDKIMAYVKPLSREEILKLQAAL